MLPRHITSRKAAMADDLDDVAVPDDLEEVALELDVVDEDADDLVEDLVEDELEADALLDDDLVEDLVEDELEAGSTGDGLAPTGVSKLATVAVPAPPRGDETEEEDEEEEEDEDVEASLDVILKERLVVEDEPEDDEIIDSDDRSEATDQVLPKQPDEFVCRSCFLVKHPSQLADKKRMLCRDCV